MSQNNPKHSPVHITDAEWEVLTVAWKQSPVAASEVVEFLRPNRDWTLATVRTLLTRLVKKGALRTEKEGRRFLYWPLLTMSECVRHRSRTFIDKVFGGAPSDVILELVRESELSADDIRELRKILRNKSK